MVFVNILNVVFLMGSILNGSSGYLMSRNKFFTGIGGYTTTMMKKFDENDNHSKYTIYGGSDIVCVSEIHGEKETPSELKIEKDNLSPLVINYYGTVSTESCLALSTMIKNLDIKSKELELKYEHRIPIKLHIQSMGGELMPTFYVCDLIRNLETPVHVYIDGFVASAATTIAVCGHKRFMTKHSSMLIHQLKSSSSGKFAELKDEMSNLNMFMMNLEDIYLENTKIDKDELEKLLFSEIWLPSDKCLEYGLVDAII